jgi:uncharacterized protein with PIN domain
LFFDAVLFEVSQKVTIIWRLDAPGGSGFQFVSDLGFGISDLTLLMGRIGKAYEVRFRTLLQRARARRLEQGVQWLVAKAVRMSTATFIPLADAFTRVYEDLADKPPFRRAGSTSGNPIFWCDAGLGGLARWLRAAGYEAFWRPGIDDEVLLNEAREAAAIVLTTDSMLMERRVVRDGLIPAYWLPPTLTIVEQLTLVCREFGLTTREPRCMHCGGELRTVEKEAMKARIPPRTYRWLEEYFVCSRCDKLFWRGTHWQRILAQLAAAAKDAGR